MKSTSHDARPLVYMSTESALKQAALMGAMERAGISVRVDGTKVDSGVSEQPKTMEETLEGALNRHNGLRALGVSASYFATVESGFYPTPEGTYGCNVVIIEPADSEMHIGRDIDILYPTEVVEKILSGEYADIGVWAQEVLGMDKKDPYPYFTHGRLTRQGVIEEAIFNVAVLLQRPGDENGD